MLALYMNQHVPRAITEGLRLRGIDVITAYEDGASDMGDPELLDRAAELGRVLFTQDDDLLAEAIPNDKERESSLMEWFMHTNYVFPLEIASAIWRLLQKPENRRI